MMCDRIRKCNTSAYDVLLNSADLTEVVRCELIVKKCLHIHLVLVGLIWIPYIQQQLQQILTISFIFLIDAPSNHLCTFY